MGTVMPWKWSTPDIIPSVLIFDYYKVLAERRDSNGTMGRNACHLNSCKHCAYLELFVGCLQQTSTSMLSLKYCPIKHRCVTTKLEQVSCFDQIFQNQDGEQEPWMYDNSIKPQIEPSGPEAVKLQQKILTTIIQIDPARRSV
jgi:hypothetical protein